MRRFTGCSIVWQSLVRSRKLCVRAVDLSPNSEVEGTSLRSRTVYGPFSRRTSEEHFRPREHSFHLSPNTPGYSKSKDLKCGQRCYLIDPLRLTDRKAWRTGFGNSCLIT